MAAPSRHPARQAAEWWGFARLSGTGHLIGGAPMAVTRLSYSIAKVDSWKVVFSDGSVVQGPAPDREAAMREVSRVLRERAQQSQGGLQCPARS